MRRYIWGSLCSITNYCMNSYLVLQVTTAYARANWFLALLSLKLIGWDWFRTGWLSLLIGWETPLPCCLALVRLLHTIPQWLPQCLFMCRERWSDLQGLISKTSLQLSSLEWIQTLSQRWGGWGKRLTCWTAAHTNGIWMVFGLKRRNCLSSSKEQFKVTNPFKPDIFQTESYVGGYSLGLAMHLYLLMRIDPHQMRIKEHEPHQ